MKYILLIFILLFSACSGTKYDKTQTKVIIIKSPKLKFSDLGYIRSSEKSIELELFVAGKAVEKITINHLICVSEGCMTKSSFNEDYLNENYPNDILQNILLSLPIYDKENKVKTPNGFIQKIKNDNVDIKYVVESKLVYFKDKKNNILFKIRDTYGK